MGEGTLSGQVALVTGGTRGLGKEFVRAQLEFCLEPIEEALGPVDILVNNADRPNNQAQPCWLEEVQEDA